jgi:hypothetical protein
MRRYGPYKARPAAHMARSMTLQRTCRELTRAQQRRPRPLSQFRPQWPVRFEGVAYVRVRAEAPADLPCQASCEGHPESHGRVLSPA